MKIKKIKKIKNSNGDSMSKTKKIEGYITIGLSKIEKEKIEKEADEKDTSVSRLVRRKLFPR